MIARRYLVRGVVQGVGFRWHTRQMGQSLDLAGWVRNLPDGRVEAWAAGPEHAIARFEGFLSEGPASAVVEEVLAAPLGEEEAAGLPHPFGVWR